MKKFVYPAVIMYDEDNKIYVMSIDELGLVAEGSTVEEAHKVMDMYLNQFLVTSMAFSIDIPEPHNFDEVLQKNKQHLVILVDTEVDESKIKGYA